MSGEENEKERLDRKLIELLNELRIAIPGVQILFADPRDPALQHRFRRAG